MNTGCSVGDASSFCHDDKLFRDGRAVVLTQDTVADPSSFGDFLFGCTREADSGYDRAWHSKTSSLKMIDIDRYLAHSDSWPYVPTLRRYREIPKTKKQRIAEELGKYVGATLTEMGKGAVICVEKPYLDGFVHGLGLTIDVPFVLLAVNGGDVPLTHALQDQIMELRHLKACFANNLHSPRDSHLFHPMPIGVNGEPYLHRDRSSALPWVQRDRRLLVPPMRNTNRLRPQYVEVLSGQEYRDIVHIVSERLELESFLALLSQHQSVLSPPGRGYDCTRTWQAIAAGAVPLVVDDVTFDQRLHSLAGPKYIPRPEELSPTILEEILAALSDPAEYSEQIEVLYWKDLWYSYLV